MLVDSPSTTKRLRPCLSTTVTSQRHNHPRLTVLLDLDETLIHLHAEERTNKAPSSAETFEVFVDGKYQQVSKRPNLKTFLERASKNFDLILFTASTESYARQVLKEIDSTTQSYFKDCFFRQHCKTVTLGQNNVVFLKDLSILSSELLQRTVLVDNSLMSFVLQPENGIPITSYIGDMEDNALLVLLGFLNYLSESAEEDVRVVLNQVFKLKRLFYVEPIL